MRFDIIIKYVQNIISPTIKVKLLDEFSGMKKPNDAPNIQQDKYINVAIAILFIIFSLCDVYESRNTTFPSSFRFMVMNYFSAKGSNGL